MSHDSVDASVGMPHTMPTCVRHPDRETGLSCTRCGRPACFDCLHDAAVGKQCVDCVRQGKREQRRAVTIAGAEEEHRKPVVTIALIVVNLAIYAITVIQARSFVDLGSSTVFDRGLLWTPAVADGQWWRLITSGFLHVAPWHIAMNMLALWMLGGALEQVLGRFRFVVLYFGSLIGGSAAIFLFGSGGVGASGATWGLLLAFVVIALRTKQDLNPLIATLVLNVAIGFAIPNISWLAHGGGAVVGALITAAFIYAPVHNRTRWQVILVGAVMVMLLGLLTFQYYELSPLADCRVEAGETLCKPVR